MRVSILVLCLVPVLATTTVSAQANLLPGSPGFIRAVQSAAAPATHGSRTRPVTDETRPVEEKDGGGPSAGAIVGWIVGGIALALGVGLLVSTLSEAEQLDAI